MGSQSSCRSAAASAPSLAQHRLRVNADRSVLRRKQLLRKLLNRGGLRTTPMVTQQVRRDPEQVAPASDLTIVSPRRTEEPHVALLRQIVRQCRITRNPRQIRPQRTGRAFIEFGERIVVHRQFSRCPRWFDRLDLRKNIFPGHIEGPLSHSPSAGLTADLSNRPAGRSLLRAHVIRHQAETPSQDPGDTR